MRQEPAENHDFCQWEFVELVLRYLPGQSPLGAAETPEEVAVEHGTTLVAVESS
jgi:hypothetical protein